MFILLFKKQMTEMFRNYFVNRKTGKLRSRPQIFLFIALFVGLLALISSAFFGVARSFATALVFTDYEWLYYALLGFIAVALGVFGSVFNTYSMLYLAKDNDLLLSMPIRPSTLLGSRMASAYVLSIIYEAIVYIPAMIEYLKLSPATAANIILPSLNLFISGFAVLALTCFFGWIIAVISRKISNKNIITVVLSLVFFFGYYFVMYKFQALMSLVLNYAEKTAEVVKKYAYPFYLFGRANTGEIIPFILFAIIAFGLFLIALLIMSRTFIKLATANKGLKKKEYNSSALKTRSVKRALFMKEIRRFTGTPVYMLNSGLGMLIAPVASVIALVKGDVLRAALVNQAGEYRALIPALIVTAVCMVCAMDNLTAPSVSLEGKAIWVIRSMPAETKSVLAAKIKLHVILNLIPAEISALLLGIAFGCTAPEIVLVMLAAAAFILMTACAGLMLNLLKPDLNWTSEVIPVKQDPPLLFSMLFGFITAVLSVPVAYVLMFAGSLAGLAAITAVYFIAAVILYRWINTKGVKLFDRL